MREIGGIRQPEILIVGGGTAGWLTANLLNVLLNQPGQERVMITLVESPDTPRIGVGEATIPTLAQTLQDLRIPEKTFLRHTHATFKHAIRFEDWRIGKDTYFHTFENFSGLRGAAAADFLTPLAQFAAQQSIDPSILWWHLAQGGEPGEFAFDTGVQPYLCEARRGPKAADAADYQGRVTYAYHTNADLFADLLAEHGRMHLIHHLRDHVTDVHVGENGFITGVSTRGHGLLTADFFVDCTGFASLLIGKALQVPFIGFGQHLLCDRAIALPVPREGDPRPYTTCTALDSGWMWQIDLMTRTGAGHVYSSAHTSDDEAEALLRARVGSRADGAAARKLRMNVGRRALCWKNNCVAIGLAAGFLEPLESTGIYLIELGARLLADFFPSRGFSERGAQRYNAIMAEQFETIRDFIVMHYCLTQRSDTDFWRDVQRREHIPDTLAERLDLWREFMPAAHHFNAHHALFEVRSWQAILFGMGWKIERPEGRATLREPVALGKARELVWAAAERAITELPLHRDLLQAVHGAAPQPKPQPAKLDLQAGLRFAGLARDAGRLELSAGTSTPREAGVDESKYHEGAIVPRGPWRAPSASELDRLLSGTAQSFVAVVAVPADVLDAMRGAVERSDRAPVHGERVVGDAPDRPAIATAAQRVVECFGEPGGQPARHLGVLVNSCGWQTITGDKFDEKRIGLHLDSWSQRSEGERDTAPNRICINLGTQARRLLVVNLPLAEVMAHLKARNLLSEGMGPTDIGRMFLRAFPDYPVLSIEVRPGEAYIAPTENCIHDGASDRMTAPDVTFTSIGQYRPA